MNERSDQHRNRKNEQRLQGNAHLCPSLTLREQHAADAIRKERRRIELCQQRRDVPGPGSNHSVGEKKQGEPEQGGNDALKEEIGSCPGWRACSLNVMIF